MVGSPERRVPFGFVIPISAQTASGGDSVVSVSTTSSRRALLAGLLAGLAAAGSVRAAPVEPGSDLVGQIGRHVVAAGDTFVDIAVWWGVGYVELVAANPEIDPWLPPAGVELIIPNEHILPDVPRRGIVINLAELRLYHFGEDGQVFSMPIGIGSEGTETPLGETVITGKRKNPTWWPPPSIRSEQPDLPDRVPPGPDNPLGAYALNLGWPLYRIHGTNRSYGVGRRVSHGCIRLYPADIEALFARVRVGTPVRVVDQPVKIGWSGRRLFLEVHGTQGQADAIETGRPWLEATPEIPARQIFTFLAASGSQVAIRWPIVVRLVHERRGIPGVIAEAGTPPTR